MRLLLAAALLVPVALAQGDAMTHVIDHRFAPAVLNATEGSTVLVMSFGPSTHSMTAEDGAFDVELPAPPPGGWTERTLPAPPLGEHAFRCRYHANMTGVLHVRAAEPPTPAESPGAGALAAVAAVTVAAAAWRARRGR